MDSIRLSFVVIIVLSPCALYAQMKSNKNVSMMSTNINTTTNICKKVYIDCDANEDQKLTTHDALIQDYYGSSVSNSGDITLVGVPRIDCEAGVSCGAVYVYRFNESRWVKEQKLTASDATKEDNFGLETSISGEVALVAAPNQDCALGQNCGAVYVYRYDGNIWVEEQKLTASDLGEFDYFGRSVSIYNNLLVVASLGGSCNSDTTCGAVYVFRYNGTRWIEEQKLTRSKFIEDDTFGTSVSIYDTTIIVGAHGDICTTGLWFCGSAFIYRYDGTNWIEEQKLTASDARHYNFFGNSVSIYNNLAVVGSKGNMCSLRQDCGAVYVYLFTGSHWIEMQKLTASDAAAADWFGTSVSITNNTIVVGASGDRCDDGYICGSAYIFQIPNTSWIQTRKITASDALARDYFGSPVSIGEEFVAIGAAGGACIDGYHCGAAYIYSLTDDDCNCNSIADNCDISGHTSKDCNVNTVPDECDASDGTSLDCNNNSIPDECEECCINSDCEDDGEQCTAEYCNNGVCTHLDILCGACCDRLDGFCLNGLLQSECVGVQPLWTQGVLCNEILCDPALGSCCNIRLGTCIDRTILSDCTGEDHSWAKGDDCSVNNCPDPFVPTVSQWGFAIMTLMLLIGGKIYFGYKHRNAV